MGGAKGRDAEVSQRNRPSFAQGKEAQAKLEEFVENQNSVEHFTEWLDRSSGQIHGQRFAAFFEPESLHEHEKTADVIGVKVGNENAVYGIVAQSAGFVAAVNGFAAIQQNGSPPEPIEESGVVAIGARQAVAGAKAGD